jgi:hypothetical protein
MGGKKAVAEALGFAGEGGIARVHHWTKRGIPNGFLKSLNSIIETGEPIDQAIKFKYSIPSCSNSAEEYISWKHAARIALPGKHGFCTDCTCSYQRKMIKSGTCENPHVNIKNLDGN